jgi:hypothetical protein
MWYMGAGSADLFVGGKGAAGAYYATSPDGVTWDKPPVGTVQARAGGPHNRVADVLHPSVFHDPDDREAARRYKLVGYDPDRGYVALISPDGLNWARQGDKPIVPISYVNDMVGAFRDTRTGAYVALPKMSPMVFGRSRRTIYLSQSFDFRHWTRPEVAFVADRRDDLGSLARIEAARPLLGYPDNPNVMRTEFYGAGAYTAESGVVGFPFVFTPQRERAGAE